MLRLGRCIIIGVIIFCMQACTSARMAEDLQIGKNTYAGGDFKKALGQLLPLAVEGNAEAQYAVGYMYYYGYGVPIDDVSGIFWIKRSAAQKYPPAMKALHLLHQPVPHPVTPPEKVVEKVPTFVPKYTLQLLGSYSLEAIRAYQDNLPEKTLCWETHYNNRTWYVLTYGQYPALYQAKLAQDKLPSSIAKFSPWPRAVRDLRPL